MSTLHSFIGNGKNIGLDATERQAIRASLFHAAEQRMPAEKLFAYEKALMFSALSGLVQDSRETPQGDLTITVWHGSLFNHLQPFVLTVTRD